MLDWNSAHIVSKYAFFCKSDEGCSLVTWETAYHDWPTLTGTNEVDGVFQDIMWPLSCHIFWVHCHFTGSCFRATNILLKWDVVGYHKDGFDGSAEAIDSSSNSQRGFLSRFWFQHRVLRWNWYLGCYWTRSWDQHGLFFILHFLYFLFIVWFFYLSSVIHYLNYPKCWIRCILDTLESHFVRLLNVDGMF